MVVRKEMSLGMSQSPWGGISRLRTGKKKLSGWRKPKGSHQAGEGSIRKRWVGCSGVRGCPGSWQELPTLRSPLRGQVD